MSTVSDNVRFTYTKRDKSTIHLSIYNFIFRSQPSTKTQYSSNCIFDETHISQKGGPVSRTGIQIRFPRNQDGVYTPMNSENNNVAYNKNMKIPTFKYEKEDRFLLDECVIQGACGETTGLKSPFT